MASNRWVTRVVALVLWLEIWKDRQIGEVFLGTLIDEEWPWSCQELSTSFTLQTIGNVRLTKVRQGLHSVQ